MMMRLRFRALPTAIGVTLLALLGALAGCVAAPAQLRSDVGAWEAAAIAVYCFDVGQADSTLVVSGDASMLIDGGNEDDSDLVCSLLESHGIENLDYIVATHPHEDHIGGLAGVLGYAAVGSVYCPVTVFDSLAFEAFSSSLAELNEAICVPRPGDSFSLGDAEVTILAPLKEYEEPNDASIALRIVLGDTGFLFTGDAERMAEQDMLESGRNIKANVLHVGHHGSDTATTYPFLREVMPEYAIISCGDGNMYGHPHDNLLSRLRDADATVYRTDLHGTIAFYSDGERVTVATERNAGDAANQELADESDAPLAKADALLESDAPTAAGEEVPAMGGYIGNVNTNVFHIQSCRNLPAEKNRISFPSRDMAIDDGYIPCGNCKP